MRPLALPDCPTVGSPTSWAQLVVVGVMMVYAVVMFVVIARNVTRGYPWRAVAGVVAATWVPYVSTALQEQRNLWQFYNPAHQSWALDFGDQMLVPGMAFMGARLLRRLREAGIQPTRTTKIVWFAVSAVFGIAWAVLFRHGEEHTYSPLLHNALGKLAHDALAGPVVAATVVFTLLATVYAIMRDRHNRKTLFLAASVVAMIVVFVLLLIHDRHGLIPDVLYVRDTWTPLPHRMFC